MGLIIFLVSVFHSLNFRNTRSLHCVLFYKLVWRTEVEGLWKRRVFWQNEPNKQPQSFPEPLVGVATVSTDGRGSRVGGSCSGNPAGRQRSGLAGTRSSAPAALRLILVNLKQLLLPNCSLVQRVISVTHSFAGKVLPAQRCFTATLSARGDIWVWHKCRLPLLICKKNVSLTFLKAWYIEAHKWNIFERLGMQLVQWATALTPPCPTTDKGKNWVFLPCFLTFLSLFEVFWLAYNPVTASSNIFNINVPSVKVLEWCAHLNVTQDHWAAELPSARGIQLFCTDAIGTLEAEWDLLGETSKGHVLLLATLLLFNVNQKLLVSIIPFSKE